MEINPGHLKEIIKQAINEAELKETKRTLTLLECTQYTGIGKNKLMELAHSTRSDFPAFKVGTKFLVNKDMLDKWLEKISLEGRTL